MTIYFEGGLWYAFLLDCILYNIMSWGENRWHKYHGHWLSDHFPLNRFFGFFYLFLIIWTGFALYRMQLLY